MTKPTFVVPRDSRDELTYAVIRVEISDEAASKGMCCVMPFLAALKSAVTEWIKTTKEGKNAWEESSKDFNIGELSNYNLVKIDRILAKQGIHDIDIEVHSMEGTSEGWSYDTILANTDEL